MFDYIQEIILLKRTSKYPWYIALIISLLLIQLIGLLVSFTENILITSDNSNPSVKLYEGINIRVIIYYLLLAPLIEEIAFSSFLRGKRFQIAVSFSMQFAIVLAFLLSLTYYDATSENLDDTNLLGFITGTFIVGILIMFPNLYIKRVLFSNPQSLAEIFGNKIKENPDIFSYYSGLLFASLHIGFRVLFFPSMGLLWFAIMFLDFFFFRLIVNHLTFSYGLILGILCHILVNASSILLIYF